MKRIVALIILIPAVFLFGCFESEEVKKDIKPVSYYKNNPEDRKITIERCKEIAGSFEKDQNCKNAAQAFKSSITERTGESYDFTKQ